MENKALMRTLYLSIKIKEDTKISWDYSFKDATAAVNDSIEWGHCL
jgi:hypothetical protein